MREKRKAEIIESLKGKTPEEAIEDLQDRIFIEEMVNLGYDFEFVRICKEIIKEIKDGTRKII